MEEQQCGSVYSKSMKIKKTQRSINAERNTSLAKKGLDVSSDYAPA